MKKEKAELQKLHGQQMEYPRTIGEETSFLTAEQQAANFTTERERTALSVKAKEGDAIRERFKMLQIQNDHAVLRKVAKALDHKKKVENIRHCHAELRDAEVRLIEAKSDVESLEERNREIVQRLEEEKLHVREVEMEAKDAYKIASEALKVCKTITAGANPDEKEYFAQIPVDMTLEGLEVDIAAEESKLDYIHANNPNAIRDFERRQQDIDKLKEKIIEAEDKLGNLRRQITKIRGKWEPELDKLIEEISDAFSHNFEQIGCAGQVSIHKDDDFDQWAIQIKVKFRYAPSPSPLSRSRRSLQRQRKRNSPDPRPAPAIGRRAVGLDDLLPHVAAVTSTGSIPRCGRDQPGHGPAQRAHGARAHGGDRVPRAHQPVLPHHAQAAHGPALRPPHEDALHPERRVHARGSQKD